MSILDVIASKTHKKYKKCYFKWDIYPCFINEHSLACSNKDEQMWTTDNRKDFSPCWLVNYEFELYTAADNRQEIMVSVSFF